MSIVNNLYSIQKKLFELEKLYHKTKNFVTLLAVSKGHSVEKILEAVNAGHNAFAENYVQEAIAKIKWFEEKQIHLEWHFIGKIQSNKIALIAKNFSWVQSITHLKQAELLNKFRTNDLPPLQICLQINISEDPHKSGIQKDLDGLIKLAKQIQILPKLKLRGLMVIPKAGDRNAFQQMKQIFCQLNEKDLSLDTLSMGMSQDFEDAIAHDATMVRIGTAIFGEREYVN